MALIQEDNQSAIINGKWILTGIPLIELAEEDICYACQKDFGDDAKHIRLVQEGGCASCVVWAVMCPECAEKEDSYMHEHPDELIPVRISMVGRQRKG